MYDYTVRATFADRTMAEAWLCWLRDEHIAEVLAAGATGAQIVQLDDKGRADDGRDDDDRADGGSAGYEVRYTFASAHDFAAYERDHAPRLRADGARRFPPPAVAYARSSGTIVWSTPD